MKDYKGEQVLVIKRELLDSLGSFQGINQDVEHYLPALVNQEAHFFMDRGEAEINPHYKQLIPYALLRHEGKFLHYLRGKSGGESRLHAKGSIGIGGHINPIDADSKDEGLKTYMAGVERELHEELKIKGSFNQKVIALLNDDSNEVGKVHLGIVHVFDLETNQVSAGEAAIADLSFQNVEDLQGKLRPQLESWSQYCADFLHQIN